MLFSPSVTILMHVVASDKHSILSWCTVSVTFHFAQAATVPFHATETLGFVEPFAGGWRGTEERVECFKEIACVRCAVDLDTCWHSWFTQ